MLKGLRIILAASLTLGFMIAVWTTTLQARFFNTIGISPWGALTVEPLLIVTSFLTGLRITRVHRLISVAFIVILLCVSFTCTVSMYTRASYVALDARRAHADIAGSSLEAEKTIRRSLDSLTDRQLSGKKTLAMIDRLQKQQRRTEAQATEAAANSDLQAVADTISKLLGGIDNRSAIFVFALLASFAATFAPSYLFFSAGMMLGAARQRDTEIPERVTESDTPDAPDTSNGLNAFLNECCIEGPGLRTSPSVLYGVYRSWAEKMGKPTLNQKLFSDTMTESGYARRKDHQGRFYCLGIKGSGTQRDGTASRPRRVVTVEDGGGEDRQAMRT